MRLKIIAISLGLIAVLASMGSAADADAGGGIRVGFNALFAAKTPKEIVFPSSMGDVAFDHTLHVKRERNNCKACHDKLFPQSSAPINYKAAQHKTAETARTSCGGCHYPGGDAFESKGNCARCHTKS